MASQNPSTPVKVPATAASYTPATLDPDLRSQINALLIRDGHVTSIQDQLLHSLHSNHANWPTLIQTHALNLLRSGEITTFPALIRRVMDDIRQDTANNASSTNGAPEVNGNGSKKANGTAAENGREGSANDGGTTGQLQRRGAANEPTSLALPAAVLEDALRVTREALEMATVDIELGRAMAKDEPAEDGNESSGDYNVLLKAEETEGEEWSESGLEQEIVWVSDESSVESDAPDEAEEEESEDENEDKDKEAPACESEGSVGVTQEEQEEEDDDNDENGEEREDADNEQEDGDEYLPGGSDSDDD